LKLESSIPPPGGGSDRSTFLSVPIALVIGRLYNDTTLPLVGGFALLSILSILIMRWANRTKDQPSKQSPMPNLNPSDNFSRR